ncbi:hypothetical protein [Roseibium aggregatum]|uniref:Uncharacterized protein n=1 Tax=Roseibium aggregatum TaxID=187304 RepID=A0A939EHM7_9HYPH|nr:hypothetical protein [Roseibium aggregatum]MBN9672428.1 hypothetical protein [Roseibium aggregatum]
MGQKDENRRKAKELGAPEAEALIATVPHLAGLLSRPDIRQLQRVIDAAILNPVYEEAYRKAMNAAVIARSGNLVLRDRAKERKARRILDKRVQATRRDGLIRVDHKRMLSADALVPRTNNPDEAEYLARVGRTLGSMGVWLHLEQPYEARGREPAKWDFWFTLGRNGDMIDTDDAIIDRDELLGTTMLGAGYYRSVLTGHVQTKIKRELERFDRQYESGWSTHLDLMRDRRSAAIGVTMVSDLLGGADFPPVSIWSRAHQLRMKAQKANTGGDVVKAQIHLLVAAQVVEYNAHLLADYVSKTVAGAGLAVKILRVAKAAGEVADTVLLIVGVGSGIKALRAAGGKALSREVRHEATEQYVRDYCRKAGISEAELALPRYVRQPNGTKLGGVRSGQSSGIGSGSHWWP